MNETTYIKGFFRTTKETEAKLAELGIVNPAGWQRASDGLWASVKVPEGVFKHTPGTPALPGKLALKD